MKIEDTLVFKETLTGIPKKVSDVFKQDMLNGFVSVADEIHPSEWYPYFYRSVAVTERATLVHTSVYTFHDICHLYLRDPLPSTNKAEYILEKMVGEVCSLYISDYLLVKDLEREGLYHTCYDGQKRCFTLIGDCMVQYDMVDVIFSHAMFAIFGDSSLLRSMCSDKAALDKYLRTACNVFNADLVWNFRMSEQFSEWSSMNIRSYTCVEHYIKYLIESNLSRVISLTPTNKILENKRKLDVDLFSKDGIIFSPVKVSYQVRRSEDSLNKYRELLY